MKSVLLTILAVIFVPLQISCLRGNSAASPAAASVNPDSFAGCKRECLKKTASCLRLTGYGFDRYQQDFANLFDQGAKTTPEQDGAINLSKDGSIRVDGMLAFT